MRLRFAGRFDHTQQKILNPPPQQAALRSKPPDLTICNLLFCATHSLPSSEHSSCGRRLQTAHRAVCLTPRRGATTERSDTFVGGRRGHSPLVRLCLLSPQCESKSPLGETVFPCAPGQAPPLQNHFTTPQDQRRAGATCPAGALFRRETVGAVCESPLQAWLAPIHKKSPSKNAQRRRRWDKTCGVFALG